MTHASKQAISLLIAMAFALIAALAVNTVSFAATPSQPEQTGLLNGPLHQSDEEGEGAGEEPGEGAGEEEEEEDPDC